MLCPGCANAELLGRARTKFGTCLTVTLRPPLCGKGPSAGVEENEGVASDVLREAVSTGICGWLIGGDVTTGVGRTMGGAVFVESLTATSLAGRVRGGFVTVGFLTVRVELPDGLPCSRGVTRL